MAIPINHDLPEEIEDILKKYEEVLRGETGIESSTSETDIRNYVDEVISEIRQIRDSEPFCNE